MQRSSATRTTAVLEDHAVDDGPWGEGDLAQPDELWAPMPRDHLGHADRAAADLDTHTSRNHHNAPDTENEPAVL